MKAKKLRPLQTSRNGVDESESDWGLYDWRVIRDRNRDFLSSTAFGLALGPEVILPKRNQDNFPRVSSGLRVNLYIHSPHSSSCLDTQLGRGNFPFIFTPTRLINMLQHRLPQESRLGGSRSLPGFEPWSLVPCQYFAAVFHPSLTPKMKPQKERAQM